MSIVSSPGLTGLLRCSVEQALEVIGPMSSMSIMREALAGTRRFDQFVERLRLTETTVASRLRHLVDIGLLEKVPYAEAGQRVREEYLLTPKGQDLMPALLALMQWGDRYLQPDSSPMEVLDKASGQRLSVGYVNDAGEPVTVGAVVLVRGGQLDSKDRST